jgi:hypothetical protein
MERKNGVAAQRPDADKFYEAVTLNSLQGRQYSASERKEIDALMRQRDRLLARMPKIEDRSSCYSEGRGCHHEALFGDARSNPGRHQGL